MVDDESVIMIFNLNIYAILALVYKYSHIDE